MALTTSNATVVATHLGPEDHGIPTAVLHLAGDGWGQGFGGFDLRVHGIGWVSQLLRVIGVDSWEALPSKAVRVAQDGHVIVGIGHIIHDKWFVCDEGGPRVVTLQQLT